MPASLRSPLRLAFAALALVAIGYQLSVSADRPGFGVVNFFSFFTIQSNLMAVAVLLYLGLRRDRPDWPRLDGLRGAAVLYMAITGVVFALFLSGLREELQLTEPVVDFTVHQLMPLVLVLDWLLDPPERPLPRRLVLLWLTYPVAYGAYSLVRGAIVDWYPYPFLNVLDIGYSGVALRAVFLLPGFALAALAVREVGNRLGARRGATAETPAVAG